MSRAMPNREQLSKIVNSKPFRLTSAALSIFFIICTLFIAVQPDTFLKLGYFGIFVYNILGSGLLIIPLISFKVNLFLLVFFSALGNIFNTSVAYILGHSTHKLFPKVELVTKIKKIMKTYHLIGLYLLTILPFPIDIIGLLSGYLQIPYQQYIVINFFGKSTLFLLVALGFIAIGQS
jgi:membrane protein YqaA with SNARE-associated domain